MPLIFIDEDADFLRWKEINPRGFIVNTPRTPIATYLMLHRATCGHLTPENAAHLHWTKDYIKVVAHSINDLTGWAQEFVSPNVALQSCSSCKPS